VRIRWLKRASQDLNHVQDYIAQDNPHAAIETVLSIIETAEKLIEYPGIGRSGRIEGTRELVISGTPYFLPYRVKEDRIEIMRVMHGAQKWPQKH